MALRLKQEGNSLLRNGNTEEALIKYTKAISLNPDDAKLYANCSLCHLKLRRGQKALANATKSVSLDPLWYKAWFRRAEAFKSLRNWRCAIMAYYKTSISVDIRSDHRLKRFVQKQLIDAQLAYLSECRKENQMKGEEILKFMQLTVSKYRKNEKRKDRLKRIELFTECINAKKIVFEARLQCKEFFGFDNENKSNEPNKCYGDGLVHWNLMNKAVTFDESEDLDKCKERRFMEWIESGLCHICQYFIFEREEQLKYFKRHKPASLADFDWDRIL